ncbi:MAG: hypothetical protein QOJ63_2733 [Solirubrobacteraceae bacterium]|jgi:hypothetical protein|nr:hypothetical protein [Solirubrobacteraceae bacterium]
MFSIDTVLTHNLGPEFGKWAAAQGDAEHMRNIALLIPEGGALRRG